MTAPSKNYTAIADSAIDVASPLTQDLFTQLRDNHVNAQEQISFGFTPAQAHNHDGANSALIEVGPNFQRNPSFESGISVGWTQTAYTGGSIADNTTQEMDGAHCVAITSTSTVNGGGDMTSSGFTPVGAGCLYDLKILVKASVINVSSRLEVIWYDDTQAQISTSTVYNSTNTSTSKAYRGRILRAPSNSKFAKLKATGGVPGAGSATGTIYFDGVSWSIGPALVEPGTQYILTSYDINTSTTTTEVAASKSKVLSVPRDGTFTVGFALKISSGGTANGRIYVNGAAVGTSRTNSTGVFQDFTEDLAMLHGDTCELWSWVTGGGAGSVTQDFRLMGVAV